MAPRKLNKKNSRIENIAVRMTEWVGTTQSLIVHSFIFLGALLLAGLGVNTDQVLLILTTIVSLEAIYLSIFIQMSVNRNTESLRGVEADIDEIQEDVEGLEGDVEELTEDIDEIQEVDKQDDMQDKRTRKTLSTIEIQLKTLLSEINQIKKSGTLHSKKFLQG